MQEINFTAEELFRIQTDMSAMEQFLLICLEEYDSEENQEKDFEIVRSILKKVQI